MIFTGVWCTKSGSVMCIGFYGLLDFEANIQDMAEEDEQTIVYITLETFATKI